jgi:hypothetical protein
VSYDTLVFSQQLLLMLQTSLSGRLRLETILTLCYNMVKPLCALNTLTSQPLRLLKPLYIASRLGLTVDFIPVIHFLILRRWPAYV